MRVITALLLVVGIIIGGIGSALAQDSNPPFAGLGLPELTIVATNEGFQAPAEVAAGQVLVTLDNQSTIEAEGGLAADIMKLPAEITLEAFEDALESDGVPSFFYDIVFAGAVSALPGEQTQGVVELTAGTWLIANIDQLGIAPLTLTVTDEAPVEPVAIESAQLVHMTSYGFDFPDTIAGGEQVWEVINTSPVPHHIVIVKTDKRYTFDEVMLAFEASETGTPVAGAPADGAVSNYGYVGLLSTGQTTWQVLDMEPGEYIVMCFMTDSIDSTAFHAMQGMVDNFTVE